MNCCRSPPLQLLPFDQAAISRQQPTARGPGKGGTGGCSEQAVRSPPYLGSLLTKQQHTARELGRLCETTASFAGERKQQRRSATRNYLIPGPPLRAALGRLPVRRARPRESLFLHRQGSIACLRAKTNDTASDLRASNVPLLIRPVVRASALVVPLLKVIDAKG